ncbi:ATP-binding protein, partial [Ideonella sp.]|uniref:ATP-binding protein n=1 Tax=Ideonella sp. TaxID=1929293 RepID=UPI003BB6F0B9
SALLAAQARVRPLLQQLGVDDIDAALPAAQRSDARRALLRDAEKARDTLLRDGDGLSLAALGQELAEVDITQVPARLAQVQLDHGSLADELTRLRDQHSEARRRFEAVAGQADAALAEARRQEALSALGEVAEQYLETATASRLLKWAIDRYREQKQGPMLKRASEIFAGLTLGDFSRLTVDAEAQPPRLYARRSSGPSVEVIGLSEGTRDQLYLALRIAALELQLQSKGALPFVADDLFINFDDQRARAGLEALRDLSTRTQVIFLTHHDHLLPMVREVMGEGVNVLPLQRTAVTG